MNRQLTTTIKFNGMVTLKHISGVAIIKNLLNDSKLQGEIIRFINFFCTITMNSDSFDISWDDITYSILAKVSILNLPKCLKDLLVVLANRMSLSIMTFCTKHFFSFNLNIPLNCLTKDFITNICWTPRGNIDYKKSTEIWFNEHLMTDQKYAIAYIYCNEEYAFYFAQLITTRYPNQPWHHIDVRINPMEFYWSSLYVLKTSEATIEEIFHIIEDNTSLELYVFNILLTGYKEFSIYEYDVSVKYLWNKLNEAEKAEAKHIFLINIKNVRSKDLMLFLISQLNKEQQSQAFTTNLTEIFQCLYDGLWKDHLMPTMHHIFDIISTEAYLAILSLIIKKYAETDGLLKFEYEEILNTFWNDSPSHLKISLFQDSKVGLDLIEQVLNNGNIHSAMALLSSASKFQRKEIMRTRTASTRCASLIKLGQWQSFKELIKFTLPEEKDLKIFKLCFVLQEAVTIYAYFLRLYQWDKVKQFFMWRHDIIDENAINFEEMFITKDAPSIAYYFIITDTMNDTSYIYKWCELSGIDKNFFNKTLMKKEGNNIFSYLIEKKLKSGVDLIRIRDEFFESYSAYLDFKAVFLECEGPKICSNFILNDKMKELKMFLYWCGEYEELIKKHCLGYTMF